MPEIVTKYPEIVLDLLQKSGGKCGVDAPQKILTSCPPEHFCSFPAGEVCIYDFNDISSMTQISSSEWSEVINGVPGIYSPINFMLLFLVFAIGLALGIMLCRK